MWNSYKNLQKEIGVGAGWSNRRLGSGIDCQILLNLLNHPSLLGALHKRANTSASAFTFVRRFAVRVLIPLFVPERQTFSRWQALHSSCKDLHAFVHLYPTRT